MSRAWAGGSTRQWRKIRAAVLLANLADNNGQCTLRLDGCAGRASTAHHTLGRAVTGDDPRYLAAACMACNLKIGDPGRRGAPDPKGRGNTSWG